MTGWSRPSKLKGTPPIGEIETRCAGCGRRFVAGEEYVHRVVPPFGQRLYAHTACAATLGGQPPAAPSREETP